jgi:hypothetical protein
LQDSVVRFDEEDGHGAQLVLATDYAIGEQGAGRGMRWCSAHYVHVVTACTHVGMCMMLHMEYSLML